MQGVLCESRAVRGGLKVPTAEIKSNTRCDAIIPVTRHSALGCMLVLSFIIRALLAQLARAQVSYGGMRGSLPCNPEVASSSLAEGISFFGPKYTDNRLVIMT